MITRKSFYKQLLAGALTSITLFSCATDEATTSILNENSSNELSSKSTELSYNKITASTQQSANPISNINDSGSDYLSTRWSGFGTSSEVYIDFGTEVSLDYITMAFSKGDERKAYFSYGTSSNGSSYTDVGSKTSSGATESAEIFDLTNMETRYFRITFNGNSESEWNSVLDLKLYGTSNGGATTTATTSTTCTAVNPSNKSATTTTNSAVLTWNAIANINHYNVRYRKVGTSSYSYETSLKTNTVTLTGLDSQEEYEWQMRSKCDDGSASEYNDATETFTTTNNGKEEEEEEKKTSTTAPTGGSPYSILGSVISDWKITYPVDKNGNDSSNADDCDDRNKDAYEQRDLTKEIGSNYSDYFFVSGDEVVFKAHVGGATTSGSNYPRSEFRQLVGGDDNYWSMKEYQYLEVRVRATNLPKTKPEVSMVQIHGPDDEPLRLEYREDSQGLHVVQNENTTKTNVLDYKLGQQLFVTVTVDNGKITLYVKNEDTGKSYEDTWTAEDSTGYFKVGCYTQSNNNLETCKPGEGWDNQNPNEYGEVRIKDLKLTETY